MGCRHTFISADFPAAEYISEAFRLKYSDRLCVHRDLFHSNGEYKLYGDLAGRDFWYALSNELADNGYPWDVNVSAVGCGCAVAEGAEQIMIYISPSTRTAKTEVYAPARYRFE